MSNFIIAPSASRDLNQIAKYFLSRNLDDSWLFNT